MPAAGACAMTASLLLLPQHFAEKHETSKQTFLPKFGVLRDEEVRFRTRLACACARQLTLSQQDVQAARAASGTVAVVEKLAVRSPGIKVKRAGYSFVDISK
jgi:hypothetical protein